MACSRASKERTEACERNSVPVGAEGGRDGRRRVAGEEKLQTPNPKLQRNTKLQIPKNRFKRLSGETGRQVSQWRGRLASRPILRDPVCSVRRLSPIADRSFGSLLAGRARGERRECDRLPPGCKGLHPGECFVAGL